MSSPSEVVPLRLHPDALHDEPALAAVRPSGSVQRAAWGMATAFLVLAVLLAAVPWQQSSLGAGRVTALRPEDRQQTVEAPVAGVVVRWRVSEGDRVRAGDPVAELRDNDPELLDRLESQRGATEDERAAVVDQVRSYEAKLASAEAARDLVVAEYAGKLAALEQKKVGEVTELQVEQRQLERLEALAADGLASERAVDLARLKRDKASASLEALDREIAAQQGALGKATAEADVKVEAARAELSATRAKVADVQRKQLDLDTRVARQAQVVVAPRDGRILSLHGGPNAGQVKQGDPLATLVPDTDQPAVELWVDGNDLPLIRDGSEVRLVFEGWPALQFVGLRGAGRGTYEGRVAFVDATDDGKGKFRVVVRPSDGAQPWPDAELLRQGVRAKGWILLGQVPLGVEVWRRINGFPASPAVEKGEGGPPPSTKKPRIPTELKP